MWTVLPVPHPRPWASDDFPQAHMSHFPCKYFRVKKPNILFKLTLPKESKHCPGFQRWLATAWMRTQETVWAGFAL